MVGQIFDDVRRILLSLLFIVAFGWMAAQVVPGADSGAPVPVQAAHMRAAQVAMMGEVVPPHP